MSAEADRELQRQLEHTISGYRRDPFGVVRFTFPWGRAGSPLEGESGPEAWQRELLQQLDEGLCPALSGAEGWPEEATRLAVASSHGIGKSALVAKRRLRAMPTSSSASSIHGAAGSPLSGVSGGEEHDGERATADWRITCGNCVNCGNWS
jgi:hypothetical protein